MKKPRLYIAYGSNLNLQQMSFRCPTADVVDTAMVKDYQLLFRGGKGTSVATIEPTKGAEVPVMIWSLNKEDEIALDRYEGYPSFYRKEMMDIELNGKPTEVMVYIMNDGRPIGTPSQSYLNTILEGYEDAQFDTKPLYEALDYSVKHLENFDQKRSRSTEVRMDKSITISNVPNDQSSNNDLKCSQSFEYANYEQSELPEHGFDLNM